MFGSYLMSARPGEATARSDGEDRISPRNPNFLLHGKNRRNFELSFLRRRKSCINRKKRVGGVEFGGGGNKEGQAEVL